MGSSKIQKRGNGRLYPVQYGSCSKCRVHEEYSTFEREVVTVKFDLKKFRRYLLSVPFITYSDQQALRVTFNETDTHRRTSPWLNFIALYESNKRPIAIKHNHGLFFAMHQRSRK